MFDDITLELARIERECTAKVVARLRALQLGEAFAGLNEGQAQAADEHQQEARLGLQVHPGA